MGAEIIKIESKHRLDFTRKTGPFPQGMNGINQSSYFNMWNQGKKSCTINIASEKGRELAKRLVARSDITIENFGYGTMEKLGLTYNDLKKVKEDIIMVSSSGFGRSGPQKHYLVYGRNIQAASGLSYLTGYPGGDMGITVIWSDVITALTSAFAIMLALNYRRQTGRGQYIDVSMLEATAIQLPEFIMDYAMNGRCAERMANHSLQAAPHNCYRCSGDDKWVAIEVKNERWSDFCQALGNPGWCSDKKFATLFGRLENQDELDSHIGTWTKHHTAEEVVAVMQRHGIAAGATADLEDLFQDESLFERGSLVRVEHPEVGRRVGPGIPWSMSKAEAFHSAAPLLGQDNDYVFKDVLGLSDSEIKSLTAEGAIG